MLIDYNRINRIKVPDDSYFDMNHVCYVLIFIGVIILYMRWKVGSNQKQFQTSSIL